MKYKITILIIFLISLYSINIVRAKTNELPLFGKVIYVDSGHGGKDPGAMYKNIMEKDINLSIAKKVEERLTKLGAIVYMTRYGDYDLSVTYTINNKRSDLSRRANLINKSKADLFISIHLNAEDTGIWQGAQVFYNDKLKENTLLANIFEKQFKTDLKTTRKKKVNNELYLLKRIKIPGVLLEMGFLSNSNDRYLLKQDSYQNKLSLTIQNAIIKYFEQ